MIAQEAGVPVLQPEKIRTEESLAELEALSAEVMVVMAYGQILSQKLIEMPSKAIINLHASLLPKYRGASCIQAAILNNDAETGWTVMHVIKALDAGDIIEQQLMTIAADETGESLHERLTQAGPAALLSALEKLKNGTALRISQNEEEMTYAPKLDREEGRLDWGRPAVELDRQVRALHSWPGTFTTFVDAKGQGKRLKVFPSVSCSNEVGKIGELMESEEGGLLVGCGEGSLRLEQVQPEGSKRMSGEEFLRGVSVEKLGG